MLIKNFVTKLLSLQLINNNNFKNELLFIYNFFKLLMKYLEKGK